MKRNKEIITIIVTIVISLSIILLISNACLYAHMRKTVDITSVRWQRTMIIEERTPSGEVRQANCITSGTDMNPYWPDWIIDRTIKVVGTEEIYTIECYNELVGEMSFETDYENFMKMEVGATIKIERKEINGEEFKILWE